MKKINLSFLRTFSDRFFRSDNIVRPERDWMILLTLFFTMIVSALAYDAFLYQNIASGEMYVSVTKDELQLQSINSNVLQKVVDDFESRKTEIGVLKMQKLIDPSI